MVGGFAMVGLFSKILHSKNGIICSCKIILGTRNFTHCKSAIMFNFSFFCCHLKLNNTGKIKVTIVVHKI